MGPSSLTRDQTQAPCIGSGKSKPLDHQGSPSTLLISTRLPDILPLSDSTPQLLNHSLTGNEILLLGGCLHESLIFPTRLQILRELEAYLSLQDCPVPSILSSIKSCLLGKVHCTFPGGGSGKETVGQCRRQKKSRLNPWVRKIPSRRAWQPTPVFLPGQRNLAGYSPYNRVPESRT